MEPNKNKKIKLYLVLVLAFCFVLVGYFRFVHPKFKEKDFESRNISTKTVVVPKINVRAKEPVFPIKKDDLKMLQRITRDIFKPGEGLDLQTTVPGEEQTRKSKQKQSISELKLEATILGKKKLAIINGQMLFPGDSIHEYQLVQIEKDSVLLKTDNFLQKLEIMNHE